MGKIQEVIRDLKANGITRSDGKWLYRDAWVSEDQLVQIAANMVLQDPNFRGHAEQMGRFLGDRGYLDGEGNPIPLYYMVDGEGNPVNEALYSIMTEEEKKGIQFVPNPESAYYPELATARAQAYHQPDQSVDPYGTANHQHYLNEKALNAAAARAERSAQADFKRKVQEENTRFSQQTAENRRNELVDLRNNCVESNDPNSMACEVYRQATNTDTILSSVRDTPDFDELLGRFGVGSDKSLFDLAKTPHETAEGVMLTEALGETMKEYGGQWITLPSGLRVEYMQAGFDPKVTPLSYVDTLDGEYEKLAKDKFPDAGAPITRTRTAKKDPTNYYLASWSELHKGDIENTSVHFNHKEQEDIEKERKSFIKKMKKKDAEVLGGYNRDFVSTMRDTFSKGFFGEEIKQTGYAISSTPHVSEIVKNITNNMEKFHILQDGKPLPRTTSKSNWMGYTTKIDNYENLKNTIVDTKSSNFSVFPKAYVTMPKEGNMAVYHLDFGNGNVYSFKTLPGYGELEETIRNLAYDGIGTNNPYRFVAGDPESREMTRQLNNRKPDGHGRRALRKNVDGKNFILELDNGQCLLWEPDDYYESVEKGTREGGLPAISVYHALVYARNIMRKEQSEILGIPYVPLVPNANPPKPIYDSTMVTVSDRVVTKTDNGSKSKHTWTPQEEVEGE